jgi:site-specific DNA recombinase
VRAALYARVSTDEQAERYGLASQLTELRALAGRKGYAVLAEVVDEGISGATLDRPGLDRLRELVRQGAADVVLAHDLDRLTRDVGHCAILLEELERADVRLEFVAMTHERTAESRLLLDVKAALASYERTKIRERTRRGRLEKARQGRWPHGRPPYGYQVVDGRLAEDPPRAEVVRRIFGWYTRDGWSIRAIVRTLRAAGALKPTPWTKHWETVAVWRILQQPAYVGRAIWNRRRTDSPAWRPEGDWIMIPAPPLVSEATYARAAELLATNRTRLAGRPPTVPAPLRGHLVCGHCGRRLFLATTRGRGGRGFWRYYRCSGRDPLSNVSGRCPNGEVRAEPLEDAVWDAVAGLLRKPALLLPAFEVAQVRLGVREVEVRSEVEHLRRERMTLARRITAVAELLGDPNLPQPELRARLADLEGQRRHLDGRLDAAQARLTSRDSEAARVSAARRFCEELGPRLTALGATPAGRAEVFRACVERVVWTGTVAKIEAVLPLSPGPAAVRGSAPSAAPAGDFSNRFDQLDARNHFRATLVVAVGARAPGRRGAP